MNQPKRRRLTIVCENYWPEVASTGQLITDLAEDLAAWFDVQVLTAQPRYHGSYPRRPRRETRNGVLIRRVRTPGFDKRNHLGRVLNWLAFLAMAGLAIATACRRCTYLFVTNPPTAPWAALLTRLQRQRSFVLVYDLYPDLAQALGLLGDRSRLARLFDAFNRSAFATAEAVVVLGADMRDRLRAKLGPAARIEVIPNWADGDLIAPRLKRGSGFARRHGLLDKTVFLYAGNLGLFQDLEVLIEAVERLQGDPHARLVFVGDGGKRPLVEAAARRSGRVLLFDYVPYDQLGDLYAAADVGLIAIEPGVEQVNLPSKTYSILAAGRPFIAVAPSSRELRALADAGAGLVVGNDAGQLAAAMQTFYDKPALRAAGGKQARRLFQERYTRDRATALYASLLGAAPEPAPQRRPAPAAARTS